MLLGRMLRTSVDLLLGLDAGEHVLRTIRVGGACFELMHRPATILAGRILYAKDYECFEAFDEAIASVFVEEQQRTYAHLVGEILPAFDIRLSVNFWRPVEQRAYGFVREVDSVEQPPDVQVYRMPASLYLRARNDASAAQLIAKEACEMWELFSYMREFVLPSQGFIMEDNGAQEMEVLDAPESGIGWVYLPVQSVKA